MPLDPMAAASELRVARWRASTSLSCLAPALATATALVLGAASSAPPARAHAIESSLDRVQALNNDFLLESRFGTGEPADDAIVRLMPPGGEPIEVGRTDGEGRLRFSLPSQASPDWEVQVDRGPGHRDYLELPGSQTPPPGLEPSAPSRPIRPLALRPSTGWLLGMSAIGGGAAAMLALRRRR
ncbi:putative conserved membrane protein [Cyanobium sp. NS01]|nr:putative conserved membrane protein [Cyanobium sp. NS01]